MILDKKFWNTRWENGRTGWDIGQASPAIMDFIGSFFNKKAKIIIPGCGNAYEAQALVEDGFTDITLIDIAPVLVEKLKNKFKNLPEIKVICGDFFAHRGKYDILIEQTFFCTLLLEKRNDYVEKVYSLLKPEGQLIGVLFNVPLGTDHPPFGGNNQEYKQLFSTHFKINTLDDCKNSIPDRVGSEAFIHFTKERTTI